jgi:DNA ligase-1
MIDEKSMTLARDYCGQVSIDGWLASEKLNGCRAYFDGKQFWTRGGNVIKAPAWFGRGLPAMHLDGEINCGRDGKRGKASFAVASNAVRLGGKWFNEVSPITATPLRFSVFDAPEVPGTWRERMAEASRAVKKSACAVAVEFQKIRMAWPTAKLAADEMHLSDFCIPLAKLNVEGFMFRSPGAIGYEQGRTESLLRWKLTEH